MNKYLIIPIILSLLLVLYGQYNSGVSVSEGIPYKARVAIEVFRPGVGIIFSEVIPNLVVNAGLDAVERYLGQQGYAAFNYIALSNNTTHTPAAGDTSLVNEIATAGLGRATGTYYNNAVGNWSIVKTFTASSAINDVCLSGLFNQSASGTLLAENTFTQVDLQTNDQVTVNWTISVASS